MNAVGQAFIATIISAISFIISAVVGFFFMGMRWARISESVKAIDKRLERIERQFTMIIKRDDERNEQR